MRGGEKVVEALCRLLPEADVFTLFYDPARISPFLRSRKVHSSFLNPLRRHYRSLLPLMPLALESFDLRGYDLVVSSESGPAKGVLVSSNARHVCYCHSPMRYLWDLYPDYLHEWTSSRLKRAAIAPLASWLRVWDYASAARVDQFAANSENVHRRIWRVWRRESEVIHPPVAVETFFHKPAQDYFLIVSELVAYKRIDNAVREFSRTGRKLRIAGDGPEFKHLKKLAGPNIEFCGRVPDSDLRELYAGCRAFVMPGEEDFGITPVEALASGKPVIALSRGGALESVPEDGGVFYTPQTEDGLAAAITRFESIEPGIDPARLQSAAMRFSESEFARKMRPLLVGQVSNLQAD
ncbi:MAG: glycosyltransferase [Acidobacteriota bacterium]|nr:glycosyltransferase [Acidobacteriota bacterium]